MAQFKVNAWAVVDGAVWQISRAEVSYTLNAVPQAVIAVPLGRTVNGNQPSPAHTGMSSLSYHTPVQIFARVVPQSAEATALAGQLGLDGSDLMLFDGSISSVTFGRGRTRASLILGLNGWLEQLSWSSAVNGGSHPGNPSFFTAGSVSGLTGGAGSTPFLSLNAMAGHIVNGATVTEDLWGSALNPWLQSVCDQPLILWGLEDKGAAPNTLSKEALGRISSPLPLALELGTISAELGTAIADDFADAVGNLDAVCRSTVWDLIVGRFAPQYAFAVVPRVQDAYVVPFIPGYSGGGDVHSSILGTHYHSITFHGQNPAPIRGLGLVVPMASATGADLGNADAASPGDWQGIGPIYIPDTEAKGAIPLEYAPSWACSSQTPVGFAVYTAGASGVAVGTAISPGIGTTPKGASADDRSSFAGGAAKVLANLAKTRYAQRMLQGRQIVVAGAFRLDIAPGSLVAIEGVAERHLAGIDATAEGFFGQVLRVTLVLDAESSQADTNFAIGHVRTASENGDPRTSIDGHPLYAETFLGTPLID